VEWEADPVDITAEQALSAESEDQHERTEARECNEWLRDTLKDGPVLHADLITAGRNTGFNLSALNRSKVRIGAKTVREGFGKGSKCSWTLASDASTHSS
jgi:hypothetical protein